VEGFIDSRILRVTEEWNKESEKYHTHMGPQMRKGNRRDQYGLTTPERLVHQSFTKSYDDLKAQLARL